MKFCPICQIQYADDSLQFCLEDGTRLLHQTNEDRETPTQVLSETETVVKSTPITNDWKQSQVTRFSRPTPKLHQSNPLTPIILTGLIIFIVFGCAIGGWLFLSGVGSGGKDSANITPPVTPRINRTPPANQEINPNDRGWGPLKYETSLNGERLTYYRGTTVERCQADCDQNPKCKAFTLIRAGAYNPDDPPMCYLLSEVTEVVSHTCCISAIKIY